MTNLCNQMGHIRDEIISIKILYLPGISKMQDEKPKDTWKHQDNKQS